GAACTVKFVRFESSRRIRHRGEIAVGVVLITHLETRGPLFADYVSTRIVVGFADPGRGIDGCNRIAHSVVAECLYALRTTNLRETSRGSVLESCDLSSGVGVRDPPPAGVVRELADAPQRVGNALQPSGGVVLKSDAGADRIDRLHQAIGFVIAV